MVLGTPVLAITLISAGAGARLHIGIFDPQTGRDPCAFPAHVLVLTRIRGVHHDSAGMGVISESLPVFSRSGSSVHLHLRFPVSRSRFRLCRLAHHMFVGRHLHLLAMVFSLLSYAVAIPSAVKVFNWTATMSSGSIHL